uniref:Uncharacterized protein n=1 Tax=viral metagenome TaxID=1070528 RepID=A0A6C0DQ69_9ZZZZ
MEKMCEFIDANSNLDYNITYYIHHLDFEEIIYNPNNNYDVVEYIFEFVNRKYRADFIKYYEKKSLVFIMNKNMYEILYHPYYWILNITII